MRFVGILVIFATVHLPAATLLQLSVDDMIQKSTAIVSGKVIEQSTVLRGPVVYTKYRIQVKEQWKGTPGVETSVFVPGGKYGSAVQTFSGSPILQQGQDYLLFLWTSRSGLTQVIGLSQGLYEMKQDSQGELVLLRRANGETVLDSSDRVVEDTTVSVRLREMVDRIHRTLAAVSR